MDPHPDPKKFVNVGLLWIPAEYYPRPQQPRLWSREFLKAYIDYRELFEGTPHARNSLSSYRRDLRQFQSVDILHIFSKLNCFCAKVYQSPESKIPLELLKPIAEKTLHKRLVKSWRRGKVLLTRQQLLGSLKFTLLWNVSETKDQVKVEEDLPRFFRVLYRITDFLQNPLEKELRACENEEAKDRTWFANLALMQEFCSAPTVPYLWLRYRLLYGDCVNQVRQSFPKENFRLHEKFNEITGLDLELFARLVMVIWLHYENIKPTDTSRFLVGPEFFAKLKQEIREKAKTILSKISLNQEQFRQSFKEYDRESRNTYYSYQPFWRKPLLKIQEDLYFPIDMEYLGYKSGQGIYFEINDALLLREQSASEKEVCQIEKERHSLMAFMGRVVEAYVYNLLNRIYGNGVLRRLFTQMDKDETGGVDFVIVYADSVVLVEVTALALRHNTLLTADWSEISRDIREIFFGGTDGKSKGKIKQLDDAIKIFTAEKLAELGCDLGKAPTIYPLLVMQKSIPCLIHHIECYKDWFQEEQLLGQHRNRFEIVDLEELELLEPLLKEGETLPHILNGWNTERASYGTFHNFLLKSKKASLSRNEYLTMKSEELINETTTVLFGTGRPDAGRLPN
jgi:hypothetical protein